MKTICLQQAKALIVHSVFTAIFFVTVQNKLAAQWVQVSTNQGFTSGAAQPSLAFNTATSELYIAYADDAVNAYVVKKYTGGSWVQVGSNLGFASGDPMSGYPTPSLVFNAVTHEPYIGYADGSVNAFVVKKFNGSSWLQIGSSLGFSGGASTPALAFHPSTNELYFGYADGSVNAFVVQKFNGSSWAQIGSNQGFTSDGAISLQFHPTTYEPYIGYADAALNAFVVKKFSASSWQQIGSSQGFASNGAAPSLMLHPSTYEPYIGYADGSINAFVVKKFNGASWGQIGSSQGLTSGQAGLSLAFRPATNEPYIAYADVATNAFLVKKFDGTSWVQVGSNLGYASGDAAPALIFQPATKDCYMSYGDASTNAFTVNEYANTTLPVTFNSFNVVCTGSNTIITWSTSNETDNKLFVVQRSFDGNSFSDIGRVRPANSSGLVASYTFTDQPATDKTAFYRIQQIDIDGKAIYSAIGMARCSEGINNNIRVYPNPAVEQVVVSGLEQSSSVSIVNFSGATVYAHFCNSSSETINVSHIAAGIYTIKVATGGKATYKKLVVNR